MSQRTLQSRRNTTFVGAMKNEKHYRRISVAASFKTQWPLRDNARALPSVYSVHYNIMYLHSYYCDGVLAGRATERKSERAQQGYNNNLLSPRRPRVRTLIVLFARRVFETKFMRRDWGDRKTTDRVNVIFV